MKKIKEKKILHLTLGIGYTNSALNEIAIPLKNKYKTLFYTYKSTKFNSEDIEIISGTDNLLGNILKLRNIIKNYKIDIIHCHNVHMIVLSYISCVFMNKKDKPFFMATIHTSYSNYKFRNKVMFLLGCIVLNKIVFCSESSFRSIPKYALRLVEKKYLVIQNGIDIDRIQNTISKIQSNKVKKEFIVTFVGRLIDIKNPLLVLELFNEINPSNCIFQIIGKGPLEDTIKSKIEEYNLSDKVKMLGLISRENVYRELYESDLFVSLSSVEGLPIAVMEAMYCECAVILSDIGPHREINKNSTYININPCEKSRFIKLFNYYYNLDKQSLIDIGINNRKIIERQFTTYNSLKNYCNIYDEEV